MAFQPNLLTARMNKLVIRVVDTTKNILEDDHFRQLISDIASLRSRVDIKAGSYDGVVFEGGRAIDMGNWQYSVCFNLVRGRSSRSAEDIFEPIIAHWPSLMRDIELQGDIWEYVLADCRFTGLAIPKDLRDKRVRLHSLIRAYCQDVWALRMECSNFAPIPSYCLPDCRAFSHII